MFPELKRTTPDWWCSVAVLRPLPLPVEERRIKGSKEDNRSISLLSPATAMITGCYWVVLLASLFVISNGLRGREGGDY